MNTMPFPDGSQEVLHGLLVAMPKFRRGSAERPYRAHSRRSRAKWSRSESGHSLRLARLPRTEITGGPG